LTQRQCHFDRVTPGVIRFRDEPFYVRMGRSRFKQEVRPYLTEIPIGEQGIGFDRLNSTLGWTLIGPSRTVAGAKLGDRTKGIGGLAAEQYLF
jgi:hypothetical protein